MLNGSLIVGVHDTSRDADCPDLAEKLRDLTLSCSRFDYFGPLLEADSADALLRQASAEGFRYCLVQAHGHAVIRYRDPQRGIDTNFFKALAEWTAGRDFLAAGRLTPGDGGRHDLDRLCFLVDLDAYRAIGQPEVSRLVEAGREHDRPVLPFDGVLLRCGFDLRPRSPADVATFRSYRGEGILRYGEAGDGGSPSPDWRGLLDFVKDQAKHARRGVFLGNWESYGDVESPPPCFSGPVSSVLGVAAGFKVNRILETHGFDERTRVVFFDYSPPALALKKILVEEWDGTDYPGFVASIAGRIPDAFYQLWGNLWGSAEPGSLQLDIVAALWEKELRIWGGAEAFRRHWARARGLAHRFVLCDLFAGSRPLLDAMDAAPGAVLWWSNAFHSLNSVWFYSREERKRIYREWIAKIAAISPDMLLYGKDVDNLEIGGTRIRDHLS